MANLLTGSVSVADLDEKTGFLDSENVKIRDTTEAQKHASAMKKALCGKLEGQRKKDCEKTIRVVPGGRRTRRRKTRRTRRGRKTRGRR